MLNKFEFFVSKIKKKNFHGQRRALQLVLYKPKTIWTGLTCFYFRWFPNFGRRERLKTASRNIQREKEFL